MEFKLSDHAVNGHRNEKWNAETILQAFKSRQYSNLEWVYGSTADVMYFWTHDNTCVGLIVSKVKGTFTKHRVVISGFAAEPDYWKAQNT